MAGGLIIQQPRNQVLDFADAASRLAPLLLGSGTTNQSYDVAPDVARSSDALMQLLTQRGTSTAQADKVIEDILYRAQLAFAPVLADEKKAGFYNSTVRTQLANEATARATAAAAQAVMEDQQRSLQAASQLQQSRNQSSRSGTQKTGPSLGFGKALAAVGASMLGGKALGAGKKKLDKVLEDLFRPEVGQGLDTGEFVDAADNIYDSSTFATAGGGGFPVGAAGFGGGLGGPEGIGGSMMSAEEAFLAGSADMTTLAVDSPAAGGSSSAGAEVIEAANMAPLSSQISSESAQTMGPIGTQKAIEAAGFALPEGMDAETANAMLQSGVSPDAVDPFGYDPALDVFTDPALDIGAEAAGDIAISQGLETSADAAGYNVPYYAIANRLTDGALTEAVLDIPIVGDVLGGIGDFVGEFAADNQGVGLALETYGQVTDSTLEGSDFTSSVTFGSTDFSDEYLGTNISDSADTALDDLFGDDSSVVCTESVRQGLLDRELYKLESEIAHKIFPAAMFRGYHRLAAPLVRSMRTDRKTAEFCAKFANAWGQFLVYGKPSWRAALLVALALPLTYVVGLFCRETSMMDFYRNLDKGAN